MTDPKSRKPDSETVVRLFEETRKDGLLIGKGGLNGNVLRLSPSMNIKRADIDAGVKILRKAFERIKKA